MASLSTQPFYLIAPNLFGIEPDANLGNSIYQEGRWFLPSKQVERNEKNGMGLFQCVLDGYRFRGEIDLSCYRDQFDRLHPHPLASLQVRVLQSPRDIAIRALQESYRKAYQTYELVYRHAKLQFERDYPQFNPKKYVFETECPPEAAYLGGDYGTAIAQNRTDGTIEIGSKSFVVHREVFAGCEPIQTAFEDGATIQICSANGEAKYSQVKKIIDFFYSGKTSCQSDEAVVRLYNVAFRLKVMKLVNLMQAHIFHLKILIARPIHIPLFDLSIFPPEQDLNVIQQIYQNNIENIEQAQSYIKGLLERVYAPLDEPLRDLPPTEPIEIDLLERAK
jgi:hypothetical protein